VVKAIDDLLADGGAAQPGIGCPGALERTFKAIAPTTIEEAFEVADASETGARARG